MSQPGVGGTIWMARSSWQFLVGDCEQSNHGSHGAPGRSWGGSGVTAENLPMTQAAPESKG